MVYLVLFLLEAFGNLAFNFYTLYYFGQVEEGAVQENEEAPRYAHSYQPKVGKRSFRPMPIYLGTLECAHLYEDPDHTEYK